MKTRLADSCFERDYGIDVKLKEQFAGSHLHCHDFYELDIILSGEKRGKLNREDVMLFCGDVFFLTPEDFHEYSFDGNVDILNVHFSEDSVSPTILGRLVDSGRRRFSMSGEKFRKTEKLARLLYELYCDSADVGIISRLLESILLLLSDFRDTPVRFSENCMDIQKAIVYVCAHFRENPSLSEVASIIPLNERYFCLKFKEYTGETYKEYLKRLKLRYARRLILVSPYSMLEIAERSGYATQSHFNREFKAAFGITPSSLRKGK